MLEIEEICPQWEGLKKFFRDGKTPYEEPTLVQRPDAGQSQFGIDFAERLLFRTDLRRGDLAGN